MKNPSERFADRGESPASARQSEEIAASLPTHDQIAERAYEIYAHSGYQQGRCEQNWLEAERELLHRFMSRLDGGVHPSRRAEADADDEIEALQELAPSHLHITYAEADFAGIE